ncbi:DUF6262 family protein [Spirillospora sp. NPDC048911]|uniref:DUF6262 family protein n=1 Tax=Spirillospora sp. NPDC048911 TaxID=3364527 RepID=UPI003722B1F3
MPLADNTDALRQAARRRSELARSRAETAIQDARRNTDPVSVAGIARAAGVSRSWLYTQPDLIKAISHLQGRRPAPARTGRQPASEASLQRRLEATLARNKTLREQVADLTRRLELAHGEIRRLRTSSSGTNEESSVPS